MIKDRIWTLVSRKLSGEATASELAEIDELIRTQAYSDLYLQAIDEFWATPPEKDVEFLEATYHLHLNRLKEKGFDLESDKEKELPHSFIIREPGNAPAGIHKKWYLAAGLFSLAVVSFFVFLNIKKTKGTPSNMVINHSEVSTKSGSRSKVQLPDGSYVWLNANSKLEYDNKHFGDKERKVTLTGEAYFDVAKNVQVPFIIHTNNIEIKVLGTVFNVKAYPGEKNTVTSLIKGSIEITLSGRQEKIMMKANEKLILRNENAEPDNTAGGAKHARLKDDPLVSLGQLSFSPEDNSIIETAWVQNKLVFDNETFEEVAVKMERWYDVVIRFKEEELKSLRITGTFEKETVTEALTALTFLSPFTYTIKNNTITIAK